ncbi:MAG TPA: NmrA/HSCARG family protein [Actinocatenispora sp.]
MSTEQGTIAVFGGTGQQGGAVARELLRRGHPVRAVVRDVAKAAPLAGAGAELVVGDMDDAASLDAALAGAYGVFSVQTFIGPDGLAGETRQGVAVADAAARAGVRHLVYSSVGGADRDSGVGHFESKAAVERHITALGVPATILRPPFFMDNFAGMGPVDGVLTLPLRADTVLQMIATADIGLFVADAFDRPDEYLGRQLDIAGDALTGPAMARVFAEATGVPTTFRSQPIAEVRAHSEEMATMFDWFDRVGFRADLPALRRDHPDLTTLADWAATHATASSNA